MKNTLLIALIGLTISCSTSKKAIVERTTAESVSEIMTFLASDELEGRNTGSEGIEKAADFIEKYFKKHNISPYFKTYRDILSNYDKVAFNMVGFLEGTDKNLKDEFIIIGAHYDHIGLQKPVNDDAIANGANDNASGSTAVLELAKYFSTRKTNKRSLLFVLFTAEENGLVGSKHLANLLKEKGMNIYTVVNFEMIGVPMQKSYKAYITGYEKSNMAQKINEYVNEEFIGFLPTAKQYQLFARSDNYPFYQVFKIPSQTICTFDFTNFDYYHHVDDEVSEMNFSHMSAIINKVAVALEKMAITPTQEIKMNE